jgi:hypothetical protein
VLPLLSHFPCSLPFYLLNVNHLEDVFQSLPSRFAASAPWFPTHADKFSSMRSPQLSY